MRRRLPVALVEPGQRRLPNCPSLCNGACPKAVRGQRSRSLSLGLASRYGSCMRGDWLDRSNSQLHRFIQIQPVPLFETAEKP